MKGPCETEVDAKSSSLLVTSCVQESRPVFNVKEIEMKSKSAGYVIKEPGVSKYVPSKGWRRPKLNFKLRDFVSKIVP